MIYIIRHGQTAANSAGLMQGSGSDAPLNDTGIEQSRAAAEFFKSRGISFDKLYSSPLIRAVQTAKIAAGLDMDAEVKIGLDWRIREMDYGKYESISLKELPPEVKFFFSDFVHNKAPETMENLSDIVARTGEFLEDIRPGYDGKENILIATHAIALKGFLEYLMPESKGSWWSRYIGNCAVFQFDIIDGKYTEPKEIFSFPREKK